MATVTEITITDDINGQPDAETRTFSLGSDTFEIDLTEATYVTLQKALKKFIDHGRVVHPQRSVTRRTRLTKVAGGNTAMVRDWARLNGYPDLSSRGRVPGEVQDAFDAAHAPTA